MPVPVQRKNSGSIENSAQELIGIWRPTDDKREMKARCLKYTHGEYYGGDVELLANDLHIREVVRGR